MVCLVISVDIRGPIIGQCPHKQSTITSQNIGKRFDIDLLLPHFFVHVCVCDLNMLKRTNTLKTPDNKTSHVLFSGAGGGGSGASILYILMPSLADLGLHIRITYPMFFSYYNGFVNFSML